MSVRVRRCRGGLGPLSPRRPLCPLWPLPALVGAQPLAGSIPLCPGCFNPSAASAFGLLQLQSWCMVLFVQLQLRIPPVRAAPLLLGRCFASLSPALRGLSPVGDTASPPTLFLQGWALPRGQRLGAGGDSAGRTLWCVHRPGEEGAIPRELWRSQRGRGGGSSDLSVLESWSQPGKSQEAAQPWGRPCGPHEDRG